MNFHKRRPVPRARRAHPPCIQGDAVNEQINANGLEGQLFMPHGEPGEDAVIILHERYGLAQHTLDLAQKLANDGYVALAPNLFSRWEGDKEALKAGEVRVVMPDDDIALAIDQAIDLLRAHKSLNIQRIFLMGVCQSGRYPFVVASRRHDISACIVFYGGTQERDWGANELQPMAMPDMLAKIQVPSFFVYGEADHSISIDNIRRFRNTLEEHRKSYRMRILKNSPHGFMNDTMPGRYRPDDTKVAWQMLLDFMQEVRNGQWPQDTVHWEFLSDTSPSYDFSKNVRQA